MTISLTCDYHDLSHGQPMGYIEHNFYYLVTITLFISITCFCSTFSRSNHFLPRIISSLSFAKQEDFLGREIISKISSILWHSKIPIVFILSMGKSEKAGCNLLVDFFSIFQQHYVFLRISNFEHFFKKMLHESRWKTEDGKFCRRAKLATPEGLFIMKINLGWMAVRWNKID